MINKLFKILLSIPLFILIGIVLFINWKISNQPSQKVIGNGNISRDVLKELRGLKSALKQGADNDMQKIYPEGYVFINALYGLAWCNILQDLKSTSDSLFNEGHPEIQQAWDKVNSDIGRYPFSEDLPLAYGAFYMGWNTYLLGKKLSVEKDEHRNPEEVELFKRQCAQIDSALKKYTYPVSYSGAAWPADGVVCVATLAQHDKLFPKQYSESIRTWITDVKAKLDQYGLIPHSINPGTEKPIQAARGSSQSLMLIFLKEIDSAFAENQFVIYKKNFVDNKLGLTAIREYPKDSFGFGDVDSGPVVLQLGSAATIVGMQTAERYGEHELATKIFHAIDAFGFAKQNDESKSYLLGLLPMADAFIVWGHSTLPIQKMPGDFMAFHLYSFILIIAVSILLWLLFRPKKPSSERSLHIPW